MSPQPESATGPNRVQSTSALRRDLRSGRRRELGRMWLMSLPLVAIAIAVASVLTWLLQAP